MNNEIVKYNCGACLILNPILPYGVNYDIENVKMVDINTKSWKLTTVVFTATTRRIVFRWQEM